MDNKKAMIIKGSIIVILIAIVTLIGYLLVINKNVDLKVAKNFVIMLNEKGIIENKVDVESLEFKKIDGMKSQNNHKINTLVTADFGIDIDEDHRIIGFSRKGIEKGEVKISKEDALKNAEKYVKDIYEGEVTFKKFITTEKEDEIPYYTIAFSKYYDSYPYYFDEIVLSINKTTGKLNGFSNIYSQGKPEKNHINIDKEKAENIALEKFNTINKNGKIESETVLAYGVKLEQDKHSVLCYVVNIKGDLIDGGAVSYKYFISSESGDIKDTLKVTVTETKTK